MHIFCHVDILIYDPVSRTPHTHVLIKSSTVNESSVVQFWCHFCLVP